MTETLITLLTAHLLADFPLQSDSLEGKKKEMKTLLGHVSVAVLVAWALIGNLNLAVIGILLVIFVSHLAMDAYKARRMVDDAKSFCIDQAIHIAVIIVLAWLCPRVVEDGLWGWILKDNIGWFYVAMTLVSGVILTVPAGGILIGKLTEPIRKELEENPIVLMQNPGQKSSVGDDKVSSDAYLVEGLENGGKHIGWLERFLTLLLILIGQPSGIGFLIAAKSVLRFGEIKEAKHRKLAEYIIIGTFLSFGWALTIAVFTKQGFDNWHPKTAEPIQKIHVILNSSPDAQTVQTHHSTEPLRPSSASPPTSSATIAAPLSTEEYTNPPKAADETAEEQTPTPADHPASKNPISTSQMPTSSIVTESK